MHVLLVCLTNEIAYRFIDILCRKKKLYKHQQQHVYT